MLLMVSSDDDIPDLLPGGGPTAQTLAPKSWGMPEARQESPIEIDLFEESPPSSSFDLAPASHQLNRPVALRQSPDDRIISGGASSSSFAASDGACGDGLDLSDDFDDLEFGGASSQLNVAVQAVDPDKDTPWPTGRTPFSDEIAPDFVRAKELSGFGAAPNSVFLTPVYVWRVYSAQKILTEERILAEAKLSEAEAARDQRLSELAEAKGPELSGKERFASLYSKVGEYEGAIDQKEKDLQNTGAQGSLALKAIAQEIKEKVAEMKSAQQHRDEAQERVAEADREVARHVAALKRVEIQYRNLQVRLDKVAPGKEVPPEFEVQFEKLDDEKQHIQTALDEAKKLKDALSKLWKESDKHFGEANAALQAREGKREALLISQEGETLAHHKELAGAAHEHRTQLANAARILLELKGEVPVEAGIRRQILRLDEDVREAFIHLQNLRHAQNSMDSDAYNTGRKVFVGLALGLTVLAILSAM